MSDADVFAHQHFGQRMGHGCRPALLVVDFTIGFVDPDIFGAPSIATAARTSEPLLALAREFRIPIAFSKIIYAKDGSDAGVHTMKVPRLLSLTPDNPASDFVPGLYPQAGEIVVQKRLPSAFFATELAPLLTMRGIDMIFVIGCTTSGCVRASVLDGMCHGFRMMVVEECVADRAEGPHKASLFDMSKKYADIISLDEAMRIVRDLALSP
jgi:maleamate amidohydrolase